MTLYVHSIQAGFFVPEGGLQRSPTPSLSASIGAMLRMSIWPRFLPAVTPLPIIRKDPHIAARLEIAMRAFAARCRDQRRIFTFEAASISTEFKIDVETGFGIAPHARDFLAIRNRRNPVCRIGLAFWLRRALPILHRQGQPA